jgi:hypothetical protein
VTADERRLLGDDFLPLTGGDWSIWRVAVLRSAGFPIRAVDSLASPRLAEAADALLRGQRTTGRDARRGDAATLAYEDALAVALAEVTASVREVAGDPRFREAVAWQNRRLLTTCVDRLLAGRGRDARSRARETVVARHLQRYATKNDSIGFFGPIGWAAWHATDPSTAVRPGRELLSDRTTYFEDWAIEEVAAAFARRPEVAPGLAPRAAPTNFLRGNQVHVPYGPSVELSDEDAALLRDCDGTRTVRELAAARAAGGWTEADVLARLRAMEAEGLLLLDFGGPVDAHPERLLRRRIGRIPDPPARVAAVADLDRLLAARGALAKAAGDADAVVRGIDALNDEFQRLTGKAATRRDGQTYAGRTIVYEDTTRDVEVRLGTSVLTELGPALSLVLNSARWLAGQVQADSLARFDEYFDRRRRRSGRDRVPLAGLLSLATRDFYTEFRRPPVAEPAVAGLQRRWQAILAIPPNTRRHVVAASDIAAACAEAFDGPQPGWASGLFHSPDVMIVSPSVQALNRGEFGFVLGELHAAFNTVESRAVVEQSPDRGRLLAMAEAVVGGRRIVPVAPRAWGAVTTRTSPPPALLSPTFVYWTVGNDDTSNLPVRPIPLGALEVTRSAEGLVVECRDAGRTFPLVEVIGEYLSGAVVNAFQILPPSRRTPRVAIDRLVLARETWRMPARRCAWAFQPDERRRYLRMREWVERHGMPRRAFVSVPIEIKPMFVDFTSLPLTNALAATIRRMAEARPGADVTFSEMLPDPSGLWLTDADGDAYTSELRLVAAEARHAPAGPRREGRPPRAPGTPR